MIMTSPGFPRVGVMDSRLGGLPAIRGLSRTNTTSTTTTTVGMNPLLRRIRWCGLTLSSCEPSCAAGIRGGSAAFFHVGVCHQGSYCCFFS